MDSPGRSAAAPTPRHQATPAQPPGRALYEAKPMLRAPQLDFAVWVENLAHYGVPAKEGQYGVDRAEWRLGRRVFIIPDMEPDEFIQKQAAQQSVEILFGLEDWMDRLLELADRRRIFTPPTAASIEEEEALVMPELAAVSPAAPGAQVIVQHVDHLHLHVGPEGVDGLQDLVSTGLSP